jgi:formylglycine-generating enzyme required for sulfatase activity
MSAAIILSEHEKAVLVENIRADKDSCASALELAAATGSTASEIMDILGFECDFVSVPGGNFDFQGSQLVEVPAFLLGRTQVTVRQWQALMGGSEDDSDLPKVNVSWNDIQPFLAKLTAILNIGRPPEDQIVVDLPHEVEWEYAAKAGGDFTYSGSDDADEVAWHSGNSDNRVHPVAQLKPNAWGLYDMSGNVWEWCSNLWDSASTKAVESFKAMKTRALTKL